MRGTNAIRYKYNPAERPGTNAMLITGSRAAGQFRKAGRTHACSNPLKGMENADVGLTD